MSHTLWIAGGFLYFLVGGILAMLNLPADDTFGKGVVGALMTLLAGFIVASLWPLVFGYYYLIEAPRERRLEEAMFFQPESELQELAQEALAPRVPLEWITRRGVALAELQASVAQRVKQVGERDVYQVSLENFVGMVQPGDELCEFRSPPESWAQLCGRAGVLILRNGQVKAQLVQMMN
jgi:hypothetical protein